MEKKRTKKKAVDEQPAWKQILRNSLIGFMLVVGLALTFNTQIRNALMKHNTNQYSIQKVNRDTIIENIARSEDDENVTFDFDSVESLTTEMVVQAQLTQTPPLPVIGGIAIPELELNLPIFKGLDNVALSYGAGTMFEDQEMGQRNYSLASHHVFDVFNANKMLFSPLRRAEPGQKIYITDKDMVYEYEIDNKFVVTPDQTQILDHVEGATPVITLITCEDPDATERIIVTGTLVNSYKYDAYPTINDDIFGGSYNWLF